ncbi:efflux RND transporter periplasmic adaptor subunit [Adhaeribacter sp. BT258]|uniref:Efflux RND transporter periplasmic adaptor subunit n=1 Tax=Adhaeribacter terrigena TaxID=2793070 RepID=A0ABS1C1T3_9BACT|nr:efflux RND transporter periplasmic adaptor subunit [Adhaeribacter terrigena]MBK0403351.1 efflux RND transporter periplasmic adaptor subunit [Adhaeribacter terrigena]
MKKPITILSLAIIVAFSACNSGGGDKTAQLDQLKKEQAEIEAKIATLEGELKIAGKGTELTEKPVPVNVLEVKPQAFKHYLEVQGKVDFNQNVMVSAKVPGVLTSVRVNRGDRVSKGQTLATIDASVLDLSIAELQSSVELARTVFNKQKNLWDQKIGTEIQYLTAKNNKESLENKLATLKEQRDQYNIKAPISGLVDEVLPKSGEAVAPGVGIIRVVNPAGTKIVADISESYAAKIRKGDEAVVFFPDLNKEIPATVRVVGTAINPNNRAFTIELGLKNTQDVKLNPNMIAVVRINDYSQESAMVLPVNLIQKDETSSYVYVVEQQGEKKIAKRRPVTTGQSYKDKIEVLSGVSENDKVISSGYQNLNEGQPVAF